MEEKCKKKIAFLKNGIKTGGDFFP